MAIMRFTPQGAPRLYWSPPRDGAGDEPPSGRPNKKGEAPKKGEEPKPPSSSSGGNGSGGNGSGGNGSGGGGSGSGGGNPFGPGDHRRGCFRGISVFAAWAAALEAMGLPAPNLSPARWRYDKKWLMDADMFGMMLVLGVVFEEGFSFQDPPEGAYFSLNQLAKELADEDDVPAMSNRLRGSLLPLALRSGLIIGFQETGAAEGSALRHKIHISPKGVELMRKFEDFSN